MIIDNSQSNIEVVGDIKEFKTSIDPKNLEFITTLLSFNLYSDPEQSFIREIVSNAWDSHVEAGTTNTPVIIRFRNYPGEKSVSIRDFGTGLSPERFREVYCNIGSSTKRESNEFIGGFGIGKYSSLACSNTVYITSYYEGIAYYYVMVKSGNSITTNLLVEKPTEEKNGVEVTIKNIFDLNPYNRALQYITFFPNIYIDGISDDTINKVKLRRFTNFAAASMSVSSKLLLGNVLYPLNKFLLATDVRDFIERINNTGIVIKFDVGEINITPNRESIIYNSDTVKKIENRIHAAKKELDTLVSKKLSQNYTDIIKYYHAIKDTVFYDPISDSLISSYVTGYYRVEPKSMLDASITYKNIDLRDELHNIRNIIMSQLPNFKGVVYDDRLYTKRLPYNIRKADTIECSNLLILNSGARASAIVKTFLRKNYIGYSVISDINSTKFFAYIKESIPPTNSKYLDLILNGTFESMINKAEKLNLDSDPNYLQYKKEVSKSNSTEIKDAREAILYIYNDYKYRYKKVFKRFSHAVSYIKDLKKGVILANMDSDDSLLYSFAKLKGYAVIKARKDIVSDLRNMKLKCLVDINWLIKKDPILSIVHTIVKHFPERINWNIANRVINNLDANTQKEFNKLREIDDKYIFDCTYRSIAMREEIPCDSYTEYLCLKLKDYLIKHEAVENIVKTVGFYSPLLIAAVIIKTKAYRVSGEVYNQVRNNKLLNILCKR